MKENGLHPYLIQYVACLSLFVVPESVVSNNDFMMAGEQLGERGDTFPAIKKKSVLEQANCPENDSKDKILDDS